MINFSRFFLCLISQVYKNSIRFMVNIFKYKRGERIWSGNGGREKQVSGPHKCGLLKKMTAETGNYCLFLLNDGGWRRKDGNTILTGRRRQQLYLFSGVSKSLMITPMSFNLKKQLFDVTQTTSSHFLLFLKYI